MQKVRWALITGSFKLNTKVNAYLHSRSYCFYDDLMLGIINVIIFILVPDRMLEKYDVMKHNLLLLGRYQAFFHTMIRREKMRLRLLAEKNLEHRSFIFLQDNFAEIIGLMGNIDHIIKRKILEEDQREYYLLASHSSVVNADYLQYWEKYIRVIYDRPQIDQLKKYGQLFYSSWNSVYVDIQNNHAHTATNSNALIEQKWIEKGRKPLLTLCDDHVRKLEVFRAYCGLGSCDWFVCIHVRSAGFHKEEDGANQQFRNTNMEDYYPLIEAVTERGGWVFRMGDPSMVPLKMTEFKFPSRVIDYAHSSRRRSELDVALSASCRLFISTSSGLHSLAKSFGVPALAINAPMYRGFPYFHNTMFLPPFYYSHKKERILTMHEILPSSILYSNHQRHFDRKRVSLKYVRPLDMVEALDEALKMADGQCIQLTGAALAFDHLNKKYNAHMNGFIGSHFATKYSDVLGL